MDIQLKRGLLDVCVLARVNDRASVTLVGDRKFDAEGAAVCGIDSIGVLWGHGSEEELSSAGFSAIVETPDELNNLLK
jgi:phosphoglycolate phosphatase